MPHPATRSSRQFLLALTLSAACAPVRAPPPGSTPPLGVPQPWSSEGPVRFLVLGDTQRPGAGDAANDRQRQAIYDRVAAALADSAADLVFHVGDLVDHASKASNWRDQFDALFWDHLSSPLRQRFFAVPDNHEYKGHMLQYGGGELDVVFLLFHKAAFTTHIHQRNRQSSEVLALFDGLNRELGRPFRLVSFSGHIHTFSHLALDLDGDGTAPIHQFTTGGGGATQRAAKYFGQAKHVADLDLYRQHKYAELAADAETGIDQPLFDRLRLDNTHFGYLEVVVDDPLRVIYQRFDQDTGSFNADYVYAPPESKESR